ncbi:DUF3168 domain-containing protein [Ancylobacter sp. WKF20]|uniref:DUF3168 domain-containing protein n=1 Tax=Ancylobacter sp. WKF20 TaxID=3039801 RepID=UPI002434575E|nr:DUF3168 domain-containing protein [Ancylobacter sp. WKF20]WGD32011.1 DUF3168 domain-containing protein [Ancylobacter sp. WKF20]
MTDVSLNLQEAIVAKLKASTDVLALVPSANIFDRHARPERFPCIILGEGQTVREDLTLADNHVRLYQTIHVWTRDGALIGARRIAGTVGAALRGRAFGAVPVVSARYTGARFTRDPDGETGHGVLTFEALVEEFPS